MNIMYNRGPRWVRFVGGTHQGKDVRTLEKGKVYEVFEAKFGEPGWVKVRNLTGKKTQYSARYFEEVRPDGA